jgi:hypothetical protein
MAKKRTNRDPKSPPMPLSELASMKALLPDVQNKATTSRQATQ